MGVDCRNHQFAPGLPPEWPVSEMDLAEAMVNKADLDADRAGEFGCFH
jgi:hypothetical protein